MDSQHDIMTVEEVANYIRVSERTVYEWAQKGEIPCGKLGATWRFRREEVENWLNKRLGGKASPAPKREGTDLLKTLLKPENILILEKATKTEMLDRLLDLLSGLPEVQNPAELRKGIYHREELMSTGIGQGLGIPHVRMDSVKNVVVAMGVSREPIQGYVALDEEPVQLVFMIAAAKHQHADHIRLLSSISFRFKDATLRRAVLDATDSAEVHQRIMRS